MKIFAMSHRPSIRTGRIAARTAALAAAFGLAFMACAARPVIADEASARDTAAFPSLPVPPDVEEAVRRDLAAGAPPVRPAPDAADGNLPPPDLPDITLAAELEPKTNPARAGMTGGGFHLDLPELPAVVVSVEQPVRAAHSLRLDLDEAGLRERLERTRAKTRLSNAQIDSFVAAYAARDYRPFWLDGDDNVSVTPEAERLAAILADSAADGLNPARLLARLPAIRKGVVPADQRAETDIAFSLAAWLYAHDARGGRLEPVRLSSLLTPELDIPLPQAVLEKLAQVSPHGFEAALEGYQPPHPAYRALRRELARLRQELERPVLTGSIAGAEGAPHPSGALPANWMEGPALQRGKADSRVPMLRTRLGMPASASNLYDDELITAVKEFQRANELTVNGRITPRTRAALENSLSPANPADAKPDRHALAAAIIANMERWRWLPRDLGKTHIFVNVPDFRLRLMHAGVVTFETRVIVGKPQTQTPIFSDEMEHLIVNPSWHVPPSILKKEFLPNMARDPGYAARRGYEVVRRGNSISIRQPPGERNALGHVKFMFPNRHSVYLHDTPTRHLFASETRAFSHGCVRVQNPFSLAEKLLGAQGFSEAQLRGMVGRGERMIRLDEKIPVHLTYFTVFVDESGVLQQRRDLYGHDGRLRAALAL